MASKYECKNCGETILPEDIEYLKTRINKMKEDLADLEEKLAANGNGFCDELCEDRFNGEA